MSFGARADHWGAVRTVFRAQCDGRRKTAILFVAYVKALYIMR